MTGGGASRRIDEITEEKKRVPYRRHSGHYYMAIEEVEIALEADGFTGQRAEGTVVGRDP